MKRRFPWLAEVTLIMFFWGIVGFVLWDTYRNAEPGPVYPDVCEPAPYGDRMDLYRRW